MSLDPSRTQDAGLLGGELLVGEDALVLEGGESSLLDHVGFGGCGLRNGRARASARGRRLVVRVRSLTLPLLGLPTRHAVAAALLFLQ